MLIRNFLALAAAACLAACQPFLGSLAGMGAAAGPPPAVQQVAQLARGPVDFALHAFDASLYAFDLAMDLKRPAPGSAEAKHIAALGRRVLSALGAVDAAQKAGSSATYDQAFREANAALDQFKAALHVPDSTTALLEMDPHPNLILTPADRARVLARADDPHNPASAGLLGGGY